MSTNSFNAPFTRAVVNAMRRLYPENLAEKSWDNTGLLLEAPYDASRRQRNSVLLTVDLTKAVADEAIERRDSIVVAYHPIIFRGLKSITSNDTQQQSLLRLAAAGISVYSPHTAIDAAPDGLGDWLADIVTGSPTSGSQISSKPPTPSSTNADDPFTNKRPTYLLQHHPSTNASEQILKLAATKHTRTPIKAIDHPTHSGAGMGRIVRFAEPQRLLSLIERIARGVGNPKGFPIAVPQGRTLDSLEIKSVAICAGSGGSLFSGLNDIDLLFTGELSHHEALAAIERGQCVVTLFHSNTERGFLHSVLKSQLEEAVGDEWAKIRKEDGEGSDGVDEALKDTEVIVDVSEVDRDPYGILVSQAEDE